VGANSFISVPLPDEASSSLEPVSDGSSFLTIITGSFFYFF